MKTNFKNGKNPIPGETVGKPKRSETTQVRASDVLPGAEPEPAVTHSRGPEEGSWTQN